MPGSLRLILGDHLSPGVSSLDGYDPEHDTILMIEALDEVANVLYHKKKIAFLLTSMRHFAEGLIAGGHRVAYVKLDDPENSGSLKTEVERAFIKYRPDKIICTFPSYYNLLAEMRSWENGFGVAVEIRDSKQYLYSPKEFDQWFDGRKDTRKTAFYKAVRTKIKRLTRNHQAPDKAARMTGQSFGFEPDEVTQTVLKLVEDRFDNHFGELYPFNFAVRHSDAKVILSDLIDKDLRYWGDGQTYPAEGQSIAYQSHIAFYLNSGLLQPSDIATALQTACNDGRLPVKAAEKFIDEIIGRREFLRGMYWRKMDGNVVENFSGAARRLPAFYLTAKTDLNCVKQCVKQSEQNAYITPYQQLIILANFALLTGINPDELIAWRQAVLVDDYQWTALQNIEQANVPYAASGIYIDKVFGYCGNCRYKVKEKHGENACPFNYLYWNFFIDNKKTLENAPRLAFNYRTLSGMTISRLIEFSMDAHRFMKTML